MASVVEAEFRASEVSKRLGIKKLHEIRCLKMIKGGISPAGLTSVSRNATSNRYTAKAIQNRHGIKAYKNLRAVE